MIAVGTTAMRTLESLYWYGTKLLKDGGAPFVVDQYDPYRSKKSEPELQTAVKAVLHEMNRRGQAEIVGHTSIFIYPGYKFRVCEGLITNFHQPNSTLLLLIAALIGEDWKKIYQTLILKKKF